MELVDVVDSKSTDASPSAASGGYSEGVAGAAVGERRRRKAPRRAPGTANDGDIRRRKAATIKSQRWLADKKAKHTCRCDGIGRRSGLKIHRWRQRTGSSPVTGTKKWDTPTGVSHFFMPPTRTGGESLAQPPCAAGGGCSRAAGCAAVDHRRRRKAPRRGAGTANRPPAPYRVFITDLSYGHSIFLFRYGTI